MTFQAYRVLSKLTAKKNNNQYRSYSRVLDQSEKSSAEIKYCLLPLEDVAASFQKRSARLCRETTNMCRESNSKIAIKIPYTA